MGDKMKRVFRNNTEEKEQSFISNFYFFSNKPGDVIKLFSYTIKIFSGRNPT